MIKIKNLWLKKEQSTTFTLAQLEAEGKAVYKKRVINPWAEHEMDRIYYFISKAKKYNVDIDLYPIWAEFPYRSINSIRGKVLRLLKTLNLAHIGTYISNIGDIQK